LARPLPLWKDRGHPEKEGTMSKRARKRRDRKNRGPNHGKRPNA